MLTFKKIYKSVLIAVFLSGLHPYGASGQVPELIMDPEFRPAARAAIDSIYNFNFEGGEERLRPWKNRHPRHPLWTLMDGIRLWWEVLADLENRSHDEELFNRMARADYESARLLGSRGGHADALIVRAIANGYAARHKANRGEWVGSMNAARKALGAYNYLQERDTGLADLKLAEGLKLYYAAYLPEAYPVVRTVSWFLPPGDKQEGLRYLREAADSAVFAAAEATYFLGNIQFNYERNYGRAADHFRDLHHSYPRNVYYARYYVRTLYERDRYEEALAKIEELAGCWQREGLPYRRVLEEELYSYKGRILLEQGRADRAAAALERSFGHGEELPETALRSYHVISGYFLGRALHALGRNGEAVTVLNHVAGHSAEESYRRRAKELREKIQS